jgi:hypothetical protein
LLLPATSLTCDNPATYAKTGQFDPDSTQHALVTTLTSLELQECKFCRCTAQEPARNWRVRQQEFYFRIITAAPRSDVLAKPITGHLRSDPPSGDTPQPLPAISKTHDNALTSPFAETLPPDRSRLAWQPQP